MSHDYDETINEDRNRVMLYFGDEFGFLKVWDLTHLLLKTGLGPLVQNHRQWKGTAFNPHRIENIEISHFVSMTLRKLGQKKAKKNPQVLNPLSTNLQLRECKAHKDIITQLQIDRVDGHLITCSDDYSVRVWSSGFDLWGTIDQLTEKLDSKWFYPDKIFSQKKHNSMTQISDVLNKVKKVPGGGFDQMEEI